MALSPEGANPAKTGFLRENQPWEFLIDEFGGPVGVVPHYLAFSQGAGIEPCKLMTRIQRLIQKGIAFITIHASPTPALFRQAAEERVLPITSRGGSIVIRDMIINKRSENIYAELFDEIVQMAVKYGFVINLGTAFRSGCTADGLDAVTLAEVEHQRDLIVRAHAQGAAVTLEGPGHILMSQIDEYVAMTRSAGVPLMPLGPIVTDACPGVDHIVSAIGAAALMARSQGGIINALTRVEHLGGEPNATTLVQALCAARAAAHAATIAYHHESRNADEAYSQARAKYKTCAVTRVSSTHKPEFAGTPGCIRCGSLCPLSNGSSRGEDAR